MDNLTKIFLENGLLGAIVVVLAIVVVYLYKVHERDVQNRLRDAEKCNERYLNLTERAINSNNKTAEVIDKLSLKLEARDRSLR